MQYAKNSFKVLYKKIKSVKKLREDALKFFLQEINQSQVLGRVVGKGLKNLFLTELKICFVKGRGGGKD